MRKELGALGCSGVCCLAASLGLSCDSTAAPAEPPPDTAQVNILFIGNSLTRNRGMTSVFEAMAVDAGKNVFVEKSAVPGASLADHAINDETIVKISQIDWDFVVLQGSSVYVAFPEDHSIILPSILALEQMIRDNSDSTRIVFFLSWAYKSGDSWDGTDYTWILSSLGFAATVLMGVLAGHLMRAIGARKWK